MRGQIIPFARNIAINSDGSGVKPLGQRASFNDERIRQFDGAIIDWLPGGDGSVLMARDYVPGGRTPPVPAWCGPMTVSASTGSIPSLDPTKEDRKAAAGISGYLTDGRGNVRIRVAYEEDARGASYRAASASIIAPPVRRLATC